MSGSLDRALFERALSWEEYAAGMGPNRLLIERGRRAFRLPDPHRALWQQSGVAHVLLFTEDNCQDSVSALPPLLALRDVAGFDLRVLRRSAQLPLLRALSGDPWPRIPALFFYDAAFHELGRFVEMAPAFRALKADPAEAPFLRDHYDHLFWETELEALSEIAARPPPA